MRPTRATNSVALTCVAIPSRKVGSPDCEGVKKSLIHHCAIIVSLLCCKLSAEPSKANTDPIANWIDPQRRRRRQRTGCAIMHRTCGGCRKDLVPGRKNRTWAEVPREITVQTQAQAFRVDQLWLLVWEITALAVVGATRSRKHQGYIHSTKSPQLALINTDDSCPSLYPSTPCDSRGSMPSHGSEADTSVHDDQRE